MKSKQRAPLRILIASGAEYPNTTANSVQQMKTAHALARTGARVTLYGKDSRRRGTSPERILEYYGLSPHERLEIRMIPTVSGRNRDRVFIGRLLLRVALPIMRRQVDVCLTRVPQAFVALWPLLRSRGVIGLFEAHDLADEALSYRGIGRRTRAFQRLALRLADGIITVTESAKRAMQHRGVSPQRILVAPDAADPFPHSPPRSRLDNGVVRVGYTGSLRPDRGCTTLIRALPYVIEALPNGWSVRCTIVGGQMGQVDELRSLAGRLGLEGSVAFTGHLPHGDIPPRLEALDVLVNPLERTLVGEQYASPMKLFEYMAAQRPMVVSDLPTIREVVDESCVTFFEPGDAQDLGRAIVQAATRWPDAVAGAERAYQRFLQHYTFDARAQRISAFITRLAPPEVDP